MSNDFISVQKFLPALNMLCDIKIARTEVQKKGRLMQEGKGPYLIFVENSKNKNGAFPAIPIEFITHWRYDENASYEEFKNWENEVNKDETL